MGGEKAWENLWTDKTEEVFNDIFNVKGGKTMDDNWDATGAATPGPVTPVPSTIDRLIEMQKTFNDHLLEDNKRLKSEIAELRSAIRET